jgi:predicted flap endonuclease-1-like 5' DNA nuclease
MSLALDIIYAAHARGSHHKFALDALTHLAVPDASAWRRLFMKHCGAYVAGSKAPDDELKDFQNHVLHVRDGYWGGAADKVENWYGHLVKALAGERWSEAAWAAGVLSHYYTDPIHPFHTAQSEAENNIHRAVEWSINRSFDSLRAQAAIQFPHVAPQPGTGPSWLRAFTVEGAEFANQSYEKLIAHYDINSGVVEPTSGLDVVGRRVVAELIVYATRGFAAVLDRALAESGARAPDVSLSSDVAMALLRLPRSWLAARAEDAAERRRVEAMYDELKATGRVEQTLPEDERVLREAYAQEIMARQLAEREKERAAVITMPTRYARGYATAPETPAAMPPAPTTLPAVVAPRAEAAATPPPASTSTALAASAPLPEHRPAEVIHATFGERDGAPPRIYLHAADDVEKAPSIGPRMAERLYALGVKTVADLFAATPATLAERLDQRNVSDETIVDWQDQARLVCAVPGLRGTHAQLLVGAGYRSRDSIAAAQEDKLCAAVLAFAMTPEGHRILRDGNPPDLERIKSWLAAAIAAKVA